MPSNLQGLNLVYPDPPSSASWGGDPALELLQVPPDLTAQLDLWTNLSFQSDEPLVPHDKKYDGSGEEQAHERYDDDDERLTGVRPAGPAHPDAHHNAVTGTVVQNPQDHQQQKNQTQQQPPFDLTAFLAGLGVTPGSASAPSLAQVLSLYSQHAQSGQYASAPPPPSAPAMSSPSPSSSTSAASPATANKRPRTRKASIVSSPAPTSPAAESEAGDKDDEPQGNLSTPLSTAEDKRRRNTAASARFRAKKKEREQALEKRAKDMEQRVSELERECEALRRENGWLKGLVVGVTGAGAAPVMPAASTGGKRSWDEVETA